MPPAGQCPKGLFSSRQGELQGGGLLGAAGLAVQGHWQDDLQVNAQKVHSAAGCGKDVWKALGAIHLLCGAASMLQCGV